MRIARNFFGAVFALALTVPMVACGDDEAAFEDAPVAEEGVFEEDLNQDEGLITEDEGLTGDGLETQPDPMQDEGLNEEEPIDGEGL